MEMGRTATDLGGHLIPIQSATQFPQVADIPGHVFQTPFESVTTGLMLFLFFWGRTMRIVVQHVDVRQRKVQHYINIVIELYGHFRLKITGISRPSQHESSPCIELYCSQLSMFIKS